jgi:LPS-assembly protein
VTGNAVVSQNETILTADQADFLRRARVLYAKGKVHLTDPLGDIRASEGTINLADESALLTNATVTDKDRNYLLKGKEIHKYPGQKYRVLNGFFTTCGCDPDNPDWSIDGKEMNVQVGSTGTAHDAHFDVLGHQIAYFPYFVFPANSSRSSGFLAPRVGESGFRGFQAVQPWYWAINKSSDATVALDLETNLRVGALGEYRLITGEDNYFVIDGAFYNEGLRTQESRVDDVIDTQLADTHIPINRYDITGMVRQSLTPDLVVYGDGLTVSDSLTLRELNVWTLSRTIQPGIQYPASFNEMRNALSDWGLLYTYDNGFARMQGTWNQDLIQPQEFALQTLPDLLVSGRKELLGGLAYTDYNVQGDYFWRDQGQYGARLDLNPSLTIPMRLSKYLYGYGTVGTYETLYDVSGDVINVTPVGTGGRIWNNGLALGPLGDGGFLHRELPYVNAGLGTEFERVFDLNAFGITKLKNTIEPFVTYAYVPATQQGNLPFFDQIDRVEARSLFTYGVTSRFYAKLNPEYVLDVNQDSQADDDQPLPFLPFRPESYSRGSSTVEVLQLSVLQAYDVNHAVAEGAARFSDLELEATALPNNVWSMTGVMGYSAQTGGLQNASIALALQPWWVRNTPKLYMGRAEAGSFFQISYDYVAPGPDTKRQGVNASLTQFLSGRLYYGLFNRMGLYFAPSYDLVRDKLISAEYGIRLKSPCDCWAFDIGITKTINPSETQYQFQLTLGGLGSVGQSPFSRNPFQQRTGVLPNYQ